MQFKIENISEDSFYANILLGLPKLLVKSKKYGIKDCYLKRYPPLVENDIHTWEHDNGVLMPPDLKKFYTSINGFSFKWILRFGDAQTDIVGSIVINPLEEQVLLENVPRIEVTKNGCPYNPFLGNDLRMFPLASVGQDARVILVYHKYKFSNNIWIQTNDGKFAYITSDFTSYFRMCIAHLGIPYWQLIYTLQGLPQWVDNLITFLAPHIRKGNTSCCKEKEKEKINKINVNVFKGTYVSDDKKLAPKKKVVEKVNSPKLKQKKYVK